MADVRYINPDVFASVQGDLDVLNAYRATKGKLPLPMPEGIQPSATGLSPLPALTPPAEFGPLGLMQSFTRAKQNAPAQREEQARADVFMAKGASNVIPGLGPKLGDILGGPVYRGIQPTNTPESVLLGGTSVLAQLPSIYGIGKFVGAATPGLAVNPITRSLQSGLTGLTYGAGESVLGLEPQNALKKGLETAGTFMAFHGAGELGDAVGRGVLPTLAKTPVLKSLLPAQAISKYPQIARAITETMGKTGSVVAGGLTGLQLAKAQNAPEYEQIAQTILGGALGLMGGEKRGKLDPLVQQADKILFERKIATADRLKGDVRSAEVMDLWNIAKSFKDIDPELARRYENAAVDRGLRTIDPASQALGVPSTEVTTPFMPEPIPEGPKLLTHKPMIEGPETLRTLAPKDIDSKTRRTRGPAFIMYPKGTVGANEVGQQVEKIVALNDAVSEPLIREKVVTTANTPTEIKQSHDQFEKAKQVEPAVAEVAQVEIDKQSGLVTPEIKKEIENDLVNPQLNTRIDIQLAEAVRNLITTLGNGDPTKGSFSRFWFDQLGAYVNKQKAATTLKTNFFSDLRSSGLVPLLKNRFWRGGYRVEKRFAERFSHWLHQEDPLFNETAKKYWDKETKAGRPLTPREIQKFESINSILRKYTQPLLDEVNALRRSMGKSEIAEIKKYAPWFDAFDTALGMSGGGSWRDALTLFSQMIDGEAGGITGVSGDFIPANLEFHHKARYKTPQALLDPFSSVEKYFDQSEYFKQNAPLIQRANYFADTADKVGMKLDALIRTVDTKLAPEDLAFKQRMVQGGQTPEGYFNLAKNFRRMAEGIAGKSAGGDIDNFFKRNPLGRALNSLTQNWMGQMVTTLSVGMTQLFSLAPLAGSEIGFGRTWKSFGDTFAQEVMRSLGNPSRLDFNESVTKQVREAGRMHGVFTDAPNIFARTMGKFAEYMDMLMVKTAYNAGFRHYMEVLRPAGLPFEAAVVNAQKYGDYMSARTQAVFIKQMKPLMLQSVLMSHVMPFQNSIWASMNSLVRDGLLNKNLSLGEKTSRLAGYYASAVLVSMATRILKASPGNIWEDALLQNIPVLGAITRFGGSTAGYMGEIQRMVVSPTRENVARAGVNLFGPIGTGQLLRSVAGVQSMVKGESLSRSKVPMDVSNPLEWLRAATVGYRGTQAYADYVAERQSSRGPVEKFWEYFMDNPHD